MPQSFSTTIQVLLSLSTAIRTAELVADPKSRSQHKVTSLTPQMTVAVDPAKKLIPHSRKMSRLDGMISLLHERDPAI